MFANFSTPARIFAAYHRPRHLNSQYAYYPRLIKGDMISFLLNNIMIIVSTTDCFTNHTIAPFQTLFLHYLPMQF